jgi:hypothetical protein
VTAAKVTAGAVSAPPAAPNRSSDAHSCVAAPHDWTGGQAADATCCMTQGEIMAEQFAYDPQKVFASIRDRQEQMLAAGRKTRLELLDTYRQSLGAVADSQEKVAALSDVEWLSRLLRAQAGFTRELADASGKFARELLQA